MLHKSENSDDPELGRISSNNLMLIRATIAAMAGRECKIRSVRRVGGSEPTAPWVADRRNAAMVSRLGQMAKR